MIGNKRVIGVCTTKIQDTPRSRAIDFLHKEATRHGYKLMVFNSSYDVTKNLTDEIGAGSIYDFINYEVIDALIIFLSGFFDERVYLSIVEKAVEKGIPVILEDRVHDQCYTIQNTIESALEELINHIIKDHGVTDTFFVAGIKGNEFSEKRIDVYKKVLKDNGLPFDDSMIDYGDFWEGPTHGVVARLLLREKLPRAIICANDAMAVAVMDLLQAQGVKIPADVIVTGFDGSPRGMFSAPKLTTCSTNMNTFAEKCMDILDGHFSGKTIPTITENPYTFKRSESCGCKDEDDIDIYGLARQYHNLFTGMNGHEYIIYNELIYQLNAAGMANNAFFSSISKILDENSYLSISPSVLSFVTGQTDALIGTDEHLLVVSSHHGSISGENVKYKTSDIVPNLEEWKNDDTLYVVSALQVGKTVLGLHQSRTDNIIRDSQKINRVLSLMNLLVHMAFSDVRQRYLRKNKDISTRIDYLTELANREGITHWYKKFIAAPENREKSIALSIYHMPKYSFIYENYGIEETKSAAMFVAEALRIANPTNAFIAHTQDDEFVVINYYENADAIGKDITRATKVFYGIIDDYNTKRIREYNLEVCAGCTVSSVKKRLRIETLIRQATDELYKNSLIYKSSLTVSSKRKSSKKQYDLFNVLISKNLFSYHFQPIVSAADGEIFAYEALMRTDDAIGLNPLEVIDIASDYQRLYDIEYATMFNVMNRYVTDRDKFKDKKIFINCIPGHFLNAEDNGKLCELYSDHIHHFVFEITEQDTLSTDELNKVKFLGNEKGDNPIAVDDYGTGHSNIVNLLNYAPQVVKIDRFLMTDIHKDSNKQLLVKGVIDFAKANSIKVLAEGIETFDEMKKVIELGVDYIQGYYTGRPVLNPISEIEPGIKKEIIETYKTANA